MFSEIAEALRLILTGESLPVPLLSGPIGNAIYTDRVIFGRKAFEIQRPTGPRYGAIFGLREYMDKTRPGMFDALLQLPMSLVLSQSFGFLHRTEADDKLELKRNQMISAGDPALEQIEELVEARSQLSSKFVMGLASPIARCLCR